MEEEERAERWKVKVEGDGKGEKYMVQGKGKKAKVGGSGKGT